MCDAFILTDVLYRAQHHPTTLKTAGATPGIKMQIHLIEEAKIQMSDFEEDEIEISVETDAHYFGAMPMFVASLGRCTFAVLESYSMRLDLPVHDISMELSWKYGSKPTRISDIEMDIRWPELPDKRIKAVERAAHLCTIHNTINQCVEIVTKVNAT